MSVSKIHKANDLERTYRNREITQMGDKLENYQKSRKKLQELYWFKIFKKSNKSR